jgi:hypothetical protein
MKLLEIPVKITRRTAWKALFRPRVFSAKIPLLDLVHIVASQLPESAGAEDDAWMGSVSDELNALLKSRSQTTKESHEQD